MPFVLLTTERWTRIKRRWKICQEQKKEWRNAYTVNNVVRDIRVHARRADIKLTAPLTVQTLRKSFAQNHANAGTPMATLKTLMGHASITTTAEYYLQRSGEFELAAKERNEALLALK